jgi:hypothetical protein
MVSSSLHSRSDPAVPPAIKALGWALVVLSTLSVLQNILGSAFEFPHMVFNVGLKIAWLVAGIGFLRLKKWAVVLYFVGVIVGIIRMFVWPPSPEVGELSTSPSALALTLVVPAIVAVLVALYWERFARNVG